MSEQIESQIISRRRLFWLAATTIALGAPMTVLATSNASAQQADKALAAEQTPPKRSKKKKKPAPASSSAPKPAPAEPKQQ
jgi:hypothetical protein